MNRFTKKILRWFWNYRIRARSETIRDLLPVINDIIRYSTPERREVSVRIVELMDANRLDQERVARLG